jgi:hypothetical protein
MTGAGFGASTFFRSHVLSPRARGHLQQFHPPPSGIGICPKCKSLFVWFSDRCSNRSLLLLEDNDTVASGLLGGIQGGVSGV